MNVPEFVSKLIARGVEFHVVNEILNVGAARGVITTEIQNCIRDYKTEIIRFVKNLSNDVGIKRSSPKAHYVSSSSQRRLYFLHEFDRSSLAYNMPQVVRLEGLLDRSRIDQVFRQLMLRHESLRTSFEMVAEQVVQKVHEEVEFDLVYHQGEEGEVEGIVKDFIRPFDLGVAPLMRVGLISLSAEVHILMVDMHHIISDGTSQGILIRDFMSLFKGDTLGAIELQYKDYSEWQQSESRQLLSAGQESFWLSEFSQDVGVLDLPLDYARPRLKDYSGGTVGFSFDKEESLQLKSLSQQEGVTLFMTLLSVFNILLSKLSNQEDIVIGTPIAGRDHADLESMIGMFVNTLALRNHPVGERSFREFLRDVKDRTLRCFDNQAYQYEDLIDSLKVSRDTSRNPLFDVMFVFQNFQRETLEIADFKLEPYGSGHGVSKFDLTLTALEGEDGLYMNIEYSTQLFKESTIARFISYFKRIVHHVLKDVEVRLCEIDILSESEREELLVSFNSTSSVYPSESTVIDLFETQVLSRPDATALIFGGQEMSYGDFNKRSNLVASELILRGVGSGDIIGIMCDRSFELMVGIFGILKSGAAYLPIDAGFPQDRIDYILSDSEAKMLLVSSAVSSGFDFSGVDLMELDCTSSVADVVSGINRSEACGLAYVIYTSGSTGRPKGVMVEHRSVNNLIHYLDREYPLKESDRYLLKTNYMFDVSVTELFGWFVGGGSLEILPVGEESDMNRVLKVIARSCVTHVNFAPSVFSVFVEELMERGNLELINGLRYIFLAGEALPISLARSFLSLGTKIRLENIYGPTEGTVYSSGFSTLELKDHQVVPIGKPVGNMKLMILDKESHLQPVGVAGELHIGGVGVARGYLNNQELTSERFISHPLGNGSRLYKTGDLARWLEDGNIEFLGRMDHQVKIRGFRIELGEIENRLLEEGRIKEALVVTYGSDADKYLIGYYTSASEIKPSELKRFLSERLPDYMVPAHYVHLESFPLTSSGKIDRKSLRHPELKGERDYVAPSNEIEEKLVSLWSEVLGVSSVDIGIDSNFFELGGHSLKAMLLVNRLLKELGIEVSLQDVFTHQDVRSLSSYISDFSRTTYSGLVKSADKEHYVLSSAQRRLHFLYEFDRNSLAYNMPQAVRLEGPLSRSKFQDVFKKLISRHDILRTSFVLMDDQVMQHVAVAVDFEIEYYESEESGVQKILTSFVRPFDLSRGPLMRVGLVRVSGDVHILMVDMHHIISDATSQGILIKDFMSLFNDESLPIIEFQYKDYSEWQQGLEQQNRLLTQKDFWLAEFSGELSVLDLPTDYVRPKLKDHTGGSIDFSLTSEESLQLRKLSQQEGATMFMTLLSVFNILLSKLSNQEDIVIGTPTSGRNHASLEGMMGMFVNTLALRNYPAGDKSFRAFLSEVKDRTLRCFDNQAYQYEELIDALKLPRDTSRNPLFDISFVFQNFEELFLAIPGLRLKNYELEHKASKFDLILTGVQSEEQIHLSLSYSAQLFKRETIERFVRQFRKIVSSLLSNPEKRLDQIDILLEEDRHVLDKVFNEKSVYYPDHANVIDLFIKQATAQPSEAAIMDGGEVISYGLLEERTKTLAHHLNHLGATLEELCFVFVESPVAMITSALSVFRAGKIFVPISNELPDEQIGFLIRSYNPGWMILEKETLDRFRIIVDGFEKLFFKVCFYDLSPSEDKELLERFEFVSEDDALAGEPYHPVLLDPDRPCYIYFTSGSTNTPRAILGAYRGLNHFVDWEKGYLKIDSKPRVSQFVSPTFDAFFRDILVPLCTGGTLFVPPRERGTLKIHELIDWLDFYEINIVHCGPTLLRELTAFPKKLDKLQYILLSGESLYADDVRKWREGFGDNIQLINLYGPSETTMVKFAYAIDYDLDSSREISIGKPITGCSVLLLDKGLMPVPHGTKGEVYIRTPYMTLGYYQDKALTDSRFIHHPLVDSKNVLYKTGDLAYLREDGNYIFVGRKDRQVKIHGIRVELETIESCLASHASIKNAAVFYDDEIKLLSACVQTLNEITVKEINQFLSTSFPVYMIPSYYHFKESFPKNSNGKTDRQQLKKELQKVLIERRAIVNTPESPLQEHLVSLWSEVLGVSSVDIGIDSNFFELGGHSLKAMLLVNRLLKELGIEVSLQDVFTHQDVRSLSSYISDFSRTTYSGLVKSADKEHYVLSSAQRRLHFLYEFDRNSLAYNMSQAVRLEGPLSRSKFQDVFKKLISRHDILRTSFVLMDDQVMQHVAVAVDFEIEYYESEESGVQKILTSFVRPFDLSRGPLMRVGLVRVSGDVHILMVDMHHIISDATSQGILIKDFMSLFNDESLPIIEFQYKDYSEWQQGLEQQNRLLTQKDFWLAEFSGELSVLDLPTDYVRPKLKDHTGGSIDFSLTSEESLQLRKLSQQEGATMFMTLLSVFNILLSKLSNQEDIVIGTPTSGRNHASLEGMMGMFVNTLALRNYPAGDKSFRAFLSEVKDRTLRCFDNQAYQYEELIDALKLPRDTSRNPLFDISFVFQNFEELFLAIPGLRLKNYELEHKASKFDLILTGVQSEEQIHLSLSYSAQLFKRETIERFVRQFRKIVSSLLSNPEKRLDQIDILLEEDRHVLDKVFNEKSVYYPDHANVIDLFIKQATAQPSEAAIMDGGEVISYGLLEERTKTLAHHLNHLGATLEELCFVFVESPVAMITSALSVFRAGKIFVPISNELPDEQIGFLIRSYNPGWMILEKETLDRFRIIVDGFEKLFFKVCFYDLSPSEDKELLERFEFVSEDDALAGEPYHPVLLDPDRPCYIYFTSGSTNTPRAILGAYRGLNHFVDWEKGYLKIDSKPRVSQFVSPTFDAFFRDILVPLCTGGTLFVPPRERGTLKIHELIDWLDFYEINIVHCGPTLLRELTAFPKKLDKLQYILLSGESLYADDVRKWREGFGDNIQLINLYGPSETTMVKFAYAIDYDLDSSREISIGKPITGCSVLLLDKGLMPVPHGTKGEVYIRTPYMTLGYYQDKALTDSRFIHHPLVDSKNVLYKTGDLAYLREDGNYIFVGRKDRQVKIHGIRVELETIESCLASHASIKNAAVFYDDEIKLLSACVQTLNEITVKEINQFLSTSFPVYMIPSYYHFKESFPKNSNGKTDRQQLKKELQKVLIERRAIVNTPESPLQEHLVSLWSEVLGVSSVDIGIDSNFFELGGHSLKAMLLVNRLLKELGIEVSLQDVFTHQDVRSLSSYISDFSRTTYSGLVKSADKEHYVLSSAQRRLHFLYEFDRNSLAYNMPQAVRLEGPLSRSKFQDVFKKLISRHDILRTSFVLMDDQVMQHVAVAVDFEIEYYESEESGVQKILTSFVRPFDLSRGPLMRVGLVRVSGDVHILMVDMHHIISDATSQGILIKDFMSLFNDESLPIIEFQYKDYSEWQQGLEQQNRLLTQKDFWLAEFSGELSVLDLPTDYVRPKLKDHTGGSIDFSLTSEESLQLRKLSQQEGATMFMTLLSVFNILLSKLSNQEDIVIGTPTSGRNHASLEGMMGMFVNTLALRNYPAGDKSFRAFLSEVKDRTLRCFDNQAYQYEELIDALKLPRDTSRNPLFDVMFSYQNYDLEELTIPGLNLTRYANDFRIAKFDLTLSATEFENQLYLDIEYSKDLFTEDSVRRFIYYFKKIVSSVLKDPSIEISEIDIIPDSEKDELLHLLNDTACSHADQKFMQQLFEEQAEINGEQIAVVYGQDRISYKDLNQRSNQLAHYLRTIGVKRNQIVAIVLGRSVNMVTCLLGIVKAGAAYLPIDSNQPSKRVEHFLKDSGASVIITEANFKDKYQFFGDVLLIEDEKITKQPETNPVLINEKEDLLYVIYTSGSTGLPKAVMIGQRQYINITHAWRKAYNLASAQVNLLQIASFSFDVFSGDVSRSLLNGGKMVICPEEFRLDPQELYEIIFKESINIFEATPGIINPLMSYVKEQTLEISFLKLLILGSDICKMEDFRKLLIDFGHSMRIINSYGVTEATIDSSYYESTLSTLASTNNVPIGKPLDNVKFYVLDAHMKLLPRGISGELYIGGKGVGNGYLGRQEMTNAHFVRNPFSKEEKIYKTGDLARWLPDGNLEFLGRIDDQVKIRGFRIELGEIESQLANYPGVDASVVVTKEKQDEKYIVAYYVSANVIPSSDIKIFLSERLPGHMLPHHIIQVKCFSLTPNGKVDRRSLPEPEFTPGDEYVAPSNEIEQRLVEIWSQVLNISKETISVDANFFDLGGSSLKIIKIRSMINKEFNCMVSIAQLFTYTSISSIRNFLDSGDMNYEKIESQTNFEVSTLEDLMKKLI